MIVTNDLKRLAAQRNHPLALTAAIGLMNNVHSVEAVAGLNYEAPFVIKQPNGFVHAV